MLTTIDNPYDPLTDYDKWMMWDQDHDYYTAEYLASLAIVPDDATDEEADVIIKQAQQEIMNADVLGIYKLV